GGKPVAATPPPCGYDTFYYPQRDTGLTESKPGFTRPLNVFADTTYFEPNPAWGSYDFEVSASGWYNIDCFAISNKGKTEDVTLFADLKMPRKLDMQVYLCIANRNLIKA